MEVQEGPMGLWEGEGRDYLMGLEFQFEKVKKFLEMDGGDSYIRTRVYLMPLTVYT